MAFACAYLGFGEFGEFGEFWVTGLL